jgi:site-specific DNA recombinase
VQSIMRIYRSPVYAGRWEYGKRITQTVDDASGRRSVVVGERPVSERAVVEVPGVVTVEQWEALQRVLDGARDRFVTGTKHAYLLRGMLVCAECGYRLVGDATRRARSGPEVTLYYGCRHGRHNLAAACSRSGCRLHAAEAEARIWDQVEAWILAPEAVAEGAEARAEMVAQEAGASLSAARVALAEELAGLEREARRVLRLYRKGGVRLDAYREEEADIERQRAALAGRLADLDARIAGAEAARAEMAAADDLRRVLADRLRSEGARAFDFRRRILEAIELWGVWDHGARRLEVYSLLGQAVMDIPRYAWRARGRPKGDVLKD